MSVAYQKPLRNVQLVIFTGNSLYGFKWIKIVVKSILSSLSSKYKFWSVNSRTKQLSMYWMLFVYQTWSNQNNSITNCPIDCPSIQLDNTVFTIYFSHQFLPLKHWSVHQLPELYLLWNPFRLGIEKNITIWLVK